MHGHLNVKKVSWCTYWRMTVNDFNDVINNKALVSMLAYVKQKIYGIGVSKGAGHFPKEHVCAT